MRGILWCLSRQGRRWFGRGSARGAGARGRRPHSLRVGHWVIRQRLERKAGGWAAALGEGHGITGEGWRRALVALNGLPLSDALHERLWLTLADG